MADKEKLAELFAEIAQWLALKGENPFKIRAYEAAARIFEQLDVDLAEWVAQGKLEDIPGVGAAIAAKAAEFVQTGRIRFHDELKASIPPVLFELLRIPGLGAKKALALQQKLNLSSIGELEYACKENRLLELPGFGAKTQAKILAGIELLRRFQGRYLISEAWPVGLALKRRLLKLPTVVEAEVAGSLRRCKETVGDVDVVVSANDWSAAMQAVLKMPGVAEVIAHGSTKTSVRLESGMNVDVRVVTPEEYPCALHHFTGSREHHVLLRARAKERGVKINEYALETDAGQRLQVKTESDLYRILGLNYIEPELREGGNELQAAAENRLPVLVAEQDLLGSFHVHTNRSDGRDSLPQIVQEAKRLGWKYIGISDHSRSAYYAGGLNEESVRAQRAEIDAFNKANPDFYVFAGIESDILPDGSLDYPEEVLRQFDFVIGSVHSSFGQSREMMTRRLVTALKNPYMTMLGHPTGRLLLAREAYEVDMDEIIRTAAATNTMIEINSSPYRLDLDWRRCRQAKEAGVLLSINPDAHSTEDLGNVSYGAGIARKGWLEAADVLNTRTAAEVSAIFKRKLNLRS